jgi:hypothetical protein
MRFGLQTVRWPLAVNVIFFALIFCLDLSIPRNLPWHDWPDPYDYLHLSQVSLLNKEFYFPHTTPQYSSRPFTVPLIYKIALSNPDIIIPVQKFFHSLGAFLLVFAVSLFLSSDVVKYFFMVCTYLLMGWWNIAGWATIILSESLSLSLMFCWIASFLIFVNKQKIFFLGIHILTAVLFSFSRDTWPYIILFFYVLCCCLFFVCERSLFKPLVALVCVGILILLVQNYSMRIGERYKIPLTNTIAVRIVSDEDYLHWFAAHGMPCTDILRKDFPKAADYDINRGKVYQIYDDPGYAKLRSWVISRGKNTYMKFLITHPRYTFLFKETKPQLDRIFCYNLFYTDTAKGYSSALQNIFPAFNLLLAAVLSVISVFIYRKRKLFIGLMPLLLMIVFGFNVLVSYNADALEVERHLFVTNIMVQLSGFLSVALLFDAAINSGADLNRSDIKL